MKLFKLIFTLSFLLCMSQAFSQPGFDNDCDGSPFQPASCPIDGGVSLLVAAGALLGGKKAYDITKKS